MKQPKKYSLLQFEGNKEITTDYPLNILKSITSGDYERLEEIVQRFHPTEPHFKETSAKDWTMIIGSSNIETEYKELVIVRNAVFTGNNRSNYVTKIILPENWNIEEHPLEIAERYQNEVYCDKPPEERLILA
ncbi:hypothetical protein HOE04_00160 [archaeon]|jgi:hypothetical protein|nr:hypothetical protein [archaeon]